MSFRVLVFGVVLTCMARYTTGVVDVTLTNEFPFFGLADDTWMFCYYTGNINQQNGFQFGVEIDTGSGTTFPNWRSSGSTAGGWYVKIWDDTGDSRVGAFSCEVTEGTQTEKAITFKMKTEADVWPVAFTVTANIGDPVTLQMVQKSSRTGTLEWRKDGTVVTGQNELTLTIASVQSLDEGIYECYYQGTYSESKQGIMRLIVRDCADNKWGPPSCTSDCPVCYNGGVCDDNTGECVCPPGFLGTNCEIACTDDYIGANCDKTCYSRGDCLGHLLCVMDPYGCSCAPGLMGIECNTECPDGMYGAGCTQTCHCADGAACSKTTGACPGACEDLWTGDSCQIDICIKPENCADLFAIGGQITGNYTVGYPQPSQVFCDMDTAGGGWTVIQRRQDGSVSFNNTWDVYVQGFGDVRGELWLGLDHLHSLTSQQQHELYVQLEDWEGNTRFARYSTFSVGDSASKYTATISGFSGDVADDLTPSVTRHSINGQQFTTKDQDNDGNSVNCGATFGPSGWWFPPSCGRALLNGWYLTGCNPHCASAQGIVWYSWKGYTYSLKKTVMMIRPSSFPSSALQTCENGGTLTPVRTGAGRYTCVCTAGWIGMYCHIACNPGEFGPNCAHTCHCANGDSVCPADTGVCSSGGCAAGWVGVSCQMACSSGTFGPDCTGTCHCASGGSFCNIQTGVCSSGGCAAGWKENDCQTECSPGEFGPNCAHTCRCADGDSVCPADTGVCSSGGCAAGWKGEGSCQTPCNQGEFGAGCTGTCHCLTGDSACNIQTGACTGGCAAGWKGDDCQTVCESGEFGPGCTGTCHCASGDSVCNIQTGVCSSGGCADGWKGNNCQTPCTADEFGPGCTSTCHCAGGGSVCNIQTGVCSSGGCEAGWEGSNCQTVCTSGEFGPDCTGTCHCASGGSVCDVTTGVCSSGGCAAGWEGSNCQAACTPGEFGPGCTGTCHCEIGGSVCDVMTGVCSSGGCAAGWDGSDCQTVCTPGEFGPSCTGTCHCASGGSVCDVMTGVCSTGGCAAGWEGSNCQTGCLFGSYGEGCTETCGHCVTNTTCDVTTGICTECETPWVGGFCVEILAEVIEHPRDLDIPLNQPATFTCTSRGEPLPTVMWHHGDDQLSTSGEMLINSMNDSSSHTVTSTLTISSVTRRNNGQYTCRSKNGTVSDTSQAAVLRVLERPEILVESVQPSGSTTLQVRWTVEYSGNLDITESQVSYRLSDDTVASDVEPAVLNGTKRIHEISGLSPSTNYTIQVKARNSQGWSDPAEAGGRTGNAKTSSSAPVAAIIGGTLAAAALLIILSTGLLFYRKRQKKRNQSGNKDVALTDIGDPPESGSGNKAFVHDEETQKNHKRLSQLVTVQDVKDFLETHGLKELTKSFKEHDVDGRALRGMNDVILKDLIPKAGPRARLTALLVELKTPAKPDNQDVSTSNLNYWEIPRANLKLGKRLGRGQFGEVRLGEVRNRGVTTTVAVKTLKDSAADSDKKDLLGELEILVMVGRHDNIISLVGACTRGGPLMIVVEYAPNGCLKDWLKTNSAENGTDSAYQNQPVYPSQLPMEQLIQFGVDVANGMSHLAAMQCVHRDLAARNILLGENLVAKVSDFGLSRDIYEDSEYVKSTKSKLPLRWMAYESLFYNVYTTQSDVWSFGVLLWEIMAMGNLPYEGMKGKRMMDMIKDGGRLEKPSSCPEEIYTLMTRCWETLPEDRPTFPELKSSLNRIMQGFKTYASLLK